MKPSKHFPSAAIFLACCFAFFPFLNVYGQQATVYEKGPVHEAFVTASSEGGVILQSIALRPPAPVNENRPPQCHAEAIWIPGYWAWVKNIENFVWVSGVWRKPPPDHVWISGYWKQFDRGWAWVRGFWSKVPELQLNYIVDRPHEPKHEAIPQSPGNNYFWMPGYWEYDFSRREYRWLSGRWTQLDPNWVYVPAYYLWRPGGYLYIPGYWDYTLETRGCAYAAVTIPQEVRQTIIYTPTVILQPAQIIRWCYSYYPDYTCFFWHNWYFYPGFWEGWCCTPPWWDWPTCWCFPWSDTWWLWWWWTNPGFPNPPWIDDDTAMYLQPPPFELINLIDDVLPPPIIGPWGGVTPWELINLLGPVPVMPWDPEELGRITITLTPRAPRPPLLPGGHGGGTKILPRPPVGEVHPPGDDHVHPPPKPPTPPPPTTHTPTPGYTPPGPPVLPPTHFPTPKPPIYAPAPPPPPPVHYPQPPTYYPPPRQPHYPQPPTYYPPPRRPHHPQPPTYYPPQRPPRVPHGYPPRGYPPRGLRWPRPQPRGHGWPGGIYQPGRRPRGLRPPHQGPQQPRHPGIEIRWRGGGTQQRGH